MDQDALGIAPPVVTDPPEPEVAVGDGTTLYDRDAVVVAIAVTDFDGDGTPEVTVSTEVDDLDDLDEAWEDPEPGTSPVVTDDDVVDAPVVEDEPERRPRGWLETDVERLLKAVLSGEVQTDGVHALTPHYISQLLANHEGLDKAPSTGAVSAVLDRWRKCGAVVTTEKPYTFVDFSEAAKERGITALKAEAKEAAKADKAAKKAAAAAAEADAAAGQAAAEAANATDG